MDCPVIERIKAQDCDLKKVVVFLNLAEIHRATTFVPKQTGEHEVRIQQVSPCLMQDSVRVVGRGNCTVLEVAVEVSDCHFEDTPDVEFNEEKGEESKRQGKYTYENLNKKLKELTKQKNDLAAGIQRITQAEGYVRQFVRNQTKAKSGKNMLDLAEVDELFRFFAKKNDEYFVKKNELKEKLNQVEKEIQLVNSRLVGPSSNDENTPKDIIILIDVGQPDKPISLDITYHVDKAKWEPSYDFRINSDNDTLTLTYFGQVSQRTKEDWNRCNIELSTATPNLGSSPPDLPMKTVNFQPTFSIQRKSRGLISFKSETLEYCREMPSQSMSVQQATVKQSGAGTATFPIDRLANIPSDGKPHKLAITTIALQSTFTYYCVPSLSAQAFLRARATNESDFPLLPSEQASVFFDGNFISTTSFPMVNPGEPFTSSLGLDPSIKVVFNTPKIHSSSAKFLSANRNRVYQFNTTITNNKKTPIRILIEDSLPFSNQAEIIVELHEPEREVPEQVDDNEALNVERVQAINGQPLCFLVKSLNHLVWVRSIPPGRMISIPFSYSITWPKTREINL